MIKFFLHQEDGKTYFAVLETDEGQRVYGRTRTMSNGIVVSSFDLPALDVDKIYLRGSNRDMDLRITRSIIQYEIDELIEALREWATTGGFFPEEAKPAQTSFSQSVFSF